MLGTYNRIDDNRNKTILFILVFVAFFACLVYLLDILFLKNHWLVGLTVVGLAFFSYGNYFYSDQIILKKHRAVRLDCNANHALCDHIDNLCLAAGLARPRLYVTGDMAINAFTVGRDPAHASLVLTAGVLQKLDETELEGVVAHELAHIGNDDILLSTVLSFSLGLVRSLVDLVKHIVNAVMDFINSEDATLRMITIIFSYSFLIFLFSILLAILVIPVIEELIFYSISRKREFLADADAALLTRYPKGLAGALKKMEADEEVMSTANSSSHHLYIVSPMDDRLKSFWSGLFHSHPPIEERIAALEKMDQYGAIAENAAGIDMYKAGNL